MEAIKKNIDAIQNELRGLNNFLEDRRNTYNNLLNNPPIRDIRRETMAEFALMNAMAMGRNTDNITIEDLTGYSNSAYYDSLRVVKDEIKNHEYLPEQRIKEKDNLIAKLQNMINNTKKSDAPFAYLTRFAPDTEIEYRRIDAESMTTITENMARLDLFYNKETPFIFRKYLRNIADSLIEGAGPPEMQCGNAVRKILGCNCANGTNVDPTKDWSYTGSKMPSGGMDGQYSIRGRWGPCTQCYNTNGYCWEGTAQHPSGLGGRPYEIKGTYLDDWERVNDAIAAHIQ